MSNKTDRSDRSDPIGNLIDDLKQQGYSLKVDNGGLKYNYTEEGKPDPEVVKPLLKKLKKHNKEVKRKLLIQGPLPEWVAVRSEVVGEVVVFKSKYAEVPTKYRRCLAYTWEEARKLLEADPDPETLRNIHTTKKTFSGRII